MSNRVREIRQKAGLSQLELSIRCRMHPVQTGRIESGVRCNQNTARKIAEALGEKPEVVFPEFQNLRGW